MEDKESIAVTPEYLRSMEKKVEDLRTLMEISGIISSTLDMNELMSVVMDKAKKVMDAEACSILLYNPETNKLEFEVAMCGEGPVSDILKQKVTLEMGQGIAGWVAENRQPLIIEDVASDSRFFQNADKMTGFKTKSLIAVPLIGRSGLIGVAEMLNPNKKDYDMEIFQLLCRQFAIAIENSNFHKESIQRERLKQELDIAASLQKSFLPESPEFRMGRLSASAINISAAKIGGDLYDFVVPADGKAGIFIGDVSGKGVSAALYMAKIISDFRYFSRGLESPGPLLEGLNAMLSKSPRGMFLTSTYMIVDTLTGSAQLAVAGHPPCIMISGGNLEVLTVPSGPPLGIVQAEFPVTSISLRKGDRIIMITDGVFDAKDRDGRRIGFDTIVSFIKEHRNEEGLAKKLSGLIEEYSHGIERADDLTIVEVAWNEI